MSRTNLTREDETLFPPRSSAVRPPAVDDDFRRALDLDPEEESPFLRAQKRVPVRRGPLAKKTADRLKLVLLVLAPLARWQCARRFFMTTARTRGVSASIGQAAIEIAGTRTSPAGR